MRQWLHGSSTLNQNHQKRGESVLLPGSCTWLLKQPIFQEWFQQRSSKRTLWLNAGPGAGKSVICAYAVRHTKKTLPLAGVAYHYYSFDERLSSLTTCRNIAEQLFYQVCAQLDEIPDHMHAVVQNDNNLENLQELIKLLIAELSDTYIFLDGLDEECTEKQKWSDASEVVDFFAELANMESSTARLWCSSQPQPCVGRKLMNFPTIHITQADNTGDIEAYIANALPILESLEVDPETKISMLRELKSEARGSFLWASLMVDTVSKATSLKHLQEEVQMGLPTDIEKYYSRKIRSLACEQRGLVR